MYRLRYYKKLWGIFTWCYKYVDYATLECALKNKTNFNEKGHWAEVDEIL